jgi:opacity protein-like surface antigen
MTVREAFGCAVVLTVMGPCTALAQSAWVPQRGELAVTTTYQWLAADRHLFTNLTGPELTPLEQALGTDFQSNSLDRGHVRSHALVVDGDVGVTDALAVTGALAFIAARYRGDFPESDFDDGAFLGSVQDVLLGARYMITRDLWAFTPFAGATFPARDYVVLAHAAQGLGLNMLEVGVTVGRMLVADGAAKGYLQGTYGYAFTESPDEEFSLNRSRAAIEGGYFLGRVSLQGFTNWRRVHGGLPWHTLDPTHHADHAQFHDQIAATREWRYAAGVSFQLTDAMSIDASYGDLLWGANTHAARAVSVGWTWGFQAFSGRKLGGGFK